MSDITAPNSIVSVGNAIFANKAPFTLIAGPCQMESRDHAFDMAGALKEITGKLGIDFIYKSSFDKANRTSLGAQRGVGLDAAMAIFADLRQDLGLAVITDVHERDQCATVAEVVDTGSGNRNVLLTERGTSFGYNTLVTDFRALPQMAETGAPVIFDATHSVAQPGGLGGSSGGQREFAPVLARAAIAVGVAGLFIETHQDPDTAPSDGPNMIALADMPALLEQLKALDDVVKAF